MGKTRYVVFDGMDGSGKGTQMDLLKKKFSAHTVFIREPGGTTFAEEIRSLVRDNPLARASTPLNNFLLFWAAREELQHTLVAPTLAMGQHVFSDRADSSTFAYQICGEENENLVPLFTSLRKTVFRGRREPDLYIIFDLPAEIARERVMSDVHRNKNHFDERDLEYYDRVRRGFHRFSNWAGKIHFLDATKTPMELHEEVLTVLSRLGIT